MAVGALATNRRGLHRLGSDAALMYGGFLVVVAATFGSTPDDPLITLRYATNAVHGHGLVFNPGQRVEGFTSPLHLLVDIGVVLLPFGFALLKAKLASLLFALLAIRETGSLIDACVTSRRVKTLALVVAGLGWTLAFAASNGLETSLACWLTTAVVVHLVTGTAFRAPLRTGLYAAAAVLARPEAALLVAAFAVTATLVERSHSFWARIRWVWAPAAAALAWELIRVTYFGQWLPNTYYAKAEPTARAVHGGLLYLLRSIEPAFGFTLSVGPLLADAGLLLIGAALAFAGVKIVTQCDRLVYVLVAVAAQGVFVLKAGGDWMVGGRFIAPVAPELGVLEVLGLAWIASVARARWRVSETGVGVALGSALIVASVAPLATQRAPIWGVRRVDTASLVRFGHYSTLSTIWTAGVQLLACVPSGQEVAYSEVGYAGFARQDLVFLDTRGLTDAAVATLAPSRIKTTAGVDDPAWASPTSTVGGIILRHNPGFLLALTHLPHGQAPPNSVLDRRYLESAQVRTSAQTLTMYHRVGAECHR